MSTRAPTLFSIFLLFVLPWAASITAEDCPAKHPQFREGYRALRDKDWERAADHMLAAEKACDEDGKLTKTYGNWYEPYLPRYSLGVALYELGCYEYALHLFKSSKLEKETIPRAEEMHEKHRSLKEKCKEYLHQGVKSKGKVDCSQWHVETKKDPHHRPADEKDENRRDLDRVELSPFLDGVSSLAIRW